MTHATRPAVLAATALALAACQPLTGGETPANAIPEAVQGNWGLTENDCNPDFDPRKGLMVVTADTLTFYESRAALGPVSSVGPSRIEGTFNFTGEGQTWTVQMSLDAQDAGMVLIRRDYEGSDTPGPLRYINCDAV
ncbi:hypothetical protein GCM10011360_27320 [Primorskyibacter flagellatus]|uniref:Lipoprotein n=1 Tax=Primorskyibacter flagellatus TaxID=1387277 RepID=A0A917EFY1_9RHOB|nr:hypothetical protein [Primorskyibacter flagellatus]GGE38061.1 hypothetical protein GCM10011360_27320 [Primorskyibacter flagellatus]